MKITQEHVCKLDAIKWAWLKQQGLTVAQARTAALGEANANPKTKDANLYARWLLARASGMLAAPLVDDLYSYMDDTHLNTAFKFLWGV